VDRNNKSFKKKDYIKKNKSRKRTK
jgi:hypothetical protein